MQIIADLHVHSKYARATSKNNDLEGLSAGAKIKGIDVIATGDFTHPQYFKEMQAQLKDDGTGLYSKNGVRFIISGEISLIYGKNRMHHVVLVPSLEIGAQINDVLGKRGNLASDGRPILGLSSPEFAEIIFSISRDNVIIPAHVWTPWFSIFGSESGVDSVQEAFQDQTKNIFALETGLSSDPQMNWMLSMLDRYTLVSNSDAHSLEKLGREANVFDLSEISYDSLINAIKTRKGFVKTYEFYPEEGKYHYDGHRNCKIVWNPWETKKHNGICPVCRKPVTIGVLNRVAELADRKLGEKPPGAVPFQSIVPLATIISKVLKKGETTNAVRVEHGRLIKYFGNEFSVFEATNEQMRLATSPEIAEAIARVQMGKISWVPGHDGVFGELILEEGKGLDATDKKQSTLDEFIH